MLGDADNQATENPGGGPHQAARLLAWYDASRRDLPWRSAPGATADPYRVWLSEIMLQQTTVAAVKPYFSAFLARWPSLAALAAAPLDDVLGAWAGLGYYSRARNLHACARAVVERHGGRFPPDEAALRTLPGIGAYTAAAITAIAFGRRAVVVDGNVERIITRYHTIDTPPPAARAAIRAAADRLTPRHRPGDFAQAMMDLGATICTPRSPACPRCPLAEGCAGRLSGDPARWPVKARKPAKPERRGLAFVVHDATGRLLARTRAEKGLLGGMTEVPGSAWADAPPPDPETVAPLVARWRSCGGITHVFTHFRLELTVMTAVVPAGTFPPDGMRWLDPDAVAGAALPNVMRKVLARATG